MAQEARRNYLLRLLTPIKRFDPKDGQPRGFAFVAWHGCAILKGG
jgi:hypothetical protein